MEVDSPDEYAYVVVQFLELPYADIGDYTCVPHSWIRIRRATDRKSLVAYPDESPSITQIRIRNGDMPSQSWKLYMAIIKRETCSYEDACKFITEQLHNASTNIYSTVTSTDNKLAPATATKRYSRKLKRTNQLDPQSKNNKLKVVDKAILGDTISNSSKPSKHPNVESTSLTPPELLGHVSPDIMMETTDGREYQEEISRDVRPRYDDLLNRNSHLERIPETGNGTQAELRAGSQSITGRTLYASRNPLMIVNQIIHDSQQPQEHQLSSIYQDHLHDIAQTHRTQNKGITNLRTFLLDVSKPLTRNPNIESNTLSITQDPKNIAKHFSQLDIPKLSPVNKDHPQVSSAQKTPGQSSEVECAISKPSSNSEMANASYASVDSWNLAEHQDPSIEKIVVDEPSEVSCVEQSVLSERRADNESSVVPKSLENANYSGQLTVRSIREGLPMNEEVALNDVSFTQDVDNDEQSDSSEISSEDILTVTPNSNEQVEKSVYSLVNKADVLADQFYELFQKMKVDFSETCEIVHDMHKSLVQSHGVIERIANASKNLRDWTKGKITLTTPQFNKVMGKIQQMPEENKADRNEEENPDVNMKENIKDHNDDDSKISKNDGDVLDVNRDTDDDTEDDRDDEVLKTTRGHIRTFVLPPEYDPNDTRWTLKYRERDRALNLVELVPHSNVFINSIKLAHCKRVAKDSKALARMLLVEVFSRIALSVCSLTGARANAFDISGTHVRPGLDALARMAILSYVEKHAKKKMWGEFDSQGVINSLRSKIQDIRAKHGTTA